jgi:hypothetical protein
MTKTAGIGPALRGGTFTLGNRNVTKRFGEHIAAGRTHKRTNKGRRKKLTPRMKQPKEKTDGQV